MGRKVAGCVPVRMSGKGEFEVLLVKSRWVEGVWLFPKGGVEKSESAKECAVRETREEAGVIGKLVGKLGSFDSSTSKEKHKMFVLLVDEECDEKDKRWKERGKRERKWFSFKEANKATKNVDTELVRPELRAMLKKAKKLLRKLEKEGRLGDMGLCYADSNGDDDDGGDDDDDDDDDGSGDNGVYSDDSDD
eukprot:Plantae.Rhodophyta-Purpureofilum_apyrenoidigerum.ctg16805.p2 GENE.Plantae.Rhodophyta-Purpureofilum_apyrenoidigerum.ctg16805~~Plantae.Rhodophyta-Purpureofilum_apyrenoidigerum.ctg16805.p2  ORF type:complete len:192 (+),score=60.20 Plantae.Rhodophyta-Purpureofilum_apyrenoidigerum.ctg16805:134-709(+)